MSTLKNPVTKKVKTVEVEEIVQVDLTVSEEVARDILESLELNWSPCADEPEDELCEVEKFMLKLRKALED